MPPQASLEFIISPLRVQTRTQEWTFYFENSESPQNLMALYRGIKENT